MAKRYAALWFQHLCTDWMLRRQARLRDIPFVLVRSSAGRVVVQELNHLAGAKGIERGMLLPDCRALEPALEVIELPDRQAETLLEALAAWCIRFTPVVAVDAPDGLLLDISGCTHLWGGEIPYLRDLAGRLQQFGYRVRTAIADTIGAAWAIARYGRVRAILPAGGQHTALATLPPAALRIEAATCERLHKLGLTHIGSFMYMPAAALRRRFGPLLLLRLEQALHGGMETLRAVQPPEPYQERLPCPEPIQSRTGIEVALQQLLERLCRRLEHEGKGMRSCLLKAYRMDAGIQQVQVGTHRGSRNATHLYKLFELKLGTLYPDLGFELFVLEAGQVEDLEATQDALWGLHTRRESEVMELLDTLGGKLGEGHIHRYLPRAQYWPERSMQLAEHMDQKPAMPWRHDLPRPLHLLHQPQPIEVTVLLPDYPPMQFLYRDGRHKVAKADGPERIEQEWWLEQGVYRDYYCVEDEEGGRYWIFRAGSYYSGEAKWYLHGFFA